MDHLLELSVLEINNGLIIVFLGVDISTDTNSTITFPISFSNTEYYCDGGAWIQGIFTRTLSKTVSNVHFGWNAHHSRISGVLCIGY